MTNYRFFLILTCLALALLVYFSKDVYAAEQEVVKRTSPTEAEQQAFEKSVGYMLNRAHLTRSLAAEHMSYIHQNRSDSLVYQIDEAAQVMAYNLICKSDKMAAKQLNNIAADTSYQIAMLAGNSPIGETLANIGREQTIEARMELIGDIATSVLMFEIGRRRGLYDALLTDFGSEKFCSSLKDDVLTRYHGLVAGLGG